MDEEKKVKAALRRRRPSRMTWVAVGGLFLLIFIGPYLWGLIGFHFVYSEGDRVGQIVKLSSKGILWKTWEGAMGVTQSGAYVGYWEFSIDSQNPDKEKLLDQLRVVYRSGDLVRIHYVQHLGALYWRGKTPYLIDEVETVRTMRR